MESEHVKTKGLTSVSPQSATVDGIAIIESDAALAPDDEVDVDNMSADSSTTENDAGSCSTKSLTNSVWVYRKENGRTYHGYRPGMYPFPNDASENERLDFQYALLSHLLGNKPHLAPLASPRHILDIGTGTGSWAIEVGDIYPNAIVEATDLSPIQPTAVPNNVQFLIDDAEQADWAVPTDHYDLIHTRTMLGCFEDFKSIIEHAFVHLKPGGWMECQEIMSTPQCDDGTMTDDWPFKKWTKNLDDAAMAMGRPLRIANKLKRWLTEVGFVDVQEEVIKIPINTWPRDADLKTIGKWWQQNILAGLQAFSLAHFTRALGWSKDELEVYLIDVRKSLANRHVHAYHKFYIVWGRKPEAPSPSGSNRQQTSGPPANRP